MLFYGVKVIVQESSIPRWIFGPCPHPTWSWFCFHSSLLLMQTLGDNRGLLEYSSPFHSCGRSRLGSSSILRLAQPGCCRHLGSKPMNKISFSFFQRNVFKNYKNWNFNKMFSASRGLPGNLWVWGMQNS